MALIFATHPLFTSAITVRLSTFWVALRNYIGQVWWPEPIVAILGRLRLESQVNSRVEGQPGRHSESLSVSDDLVFRFSTVV